MNEFSQRRTWGPSPRYERVLAYKRNNYQFSIIAGPCSVESREQIFQIADFVSFSGATHLRGGVFRAGTYPPKKFGWVDESLMAAYKAAADQYKMQNIIEVLDYRDIDKVSQYASCFQVGARQTQNYTLLKEVGKSGKPVFLKRNMGSTVDEWLGAAEYILEAGCKELYLIERGSSTYHNDIRWCPTLHTIPSVKSICNVPVIFDGSHSSGRRDIVPAMTLAGVAAGADGVLIETHIEPEKSISDADQAIDLGEFRKLMYKIQSVREAIL